MKRYPFHLMAGLFSALAVMPTVAVGQDGPPPGPPEATSEAAYTQAQLDQMLAPIALYPDQLLTQILMASTYPLQVVEAARWLQDPSKAALHGEALVAALEPLPWDPSVKSLVPFPQIITMLDSQLDWTQSLGTAFANQQPDVMSEVQNLRQQARAAGNLASTPQLNVQQEGQTIAIEPANPDVVYVPVYNPTVIYGPWRYQAYPPYYFAPPPGFFIGAVGLGIGFSVGFGIVGPLWGWGHPDWREHHIMIDNARYSHITFDHRPFTGNTWHHEGPVARPAFARREGGGHPPGPAVMHAPGSPGGRPNLPRTENAGRLPGGGPNPTAARAAPRPAGPPVARDARATPEARAARAAGPSRPAQNTAARQPRPAVAAARPQGEAHPQGHAPGPKKEEEKRE